MFEINSIYSVIETPRSFAAKFRKRVKKPGETAEDSAFDFKRLYDKANGYRDKKSRNEDFTKQFLDGLHDDEIRFQVEYHKEPKSIDEVVFHVVNMI